jgi:predicted naringenin-chalcone synthase
VLEVGVNAARLLAIGTAAPRGRLDAAGSLRIAGLLSPGVEPTKLRELYEGAGVSCRGSVLIDEDARQDLYTGDAPRGPGTAARLARYYDAACALGAEAAARALARAETPCAAVTHVVTVSCTGAQSPGVDHGLIERLGLSRDVSRTHIGFMGCHGGINGLAVASSIVRAEPGAVALVACVELCSLHYHVGGSWDQQVANAIFADGAACAVVGSAGNGPVLGAFGSRVFPGTAGLMRWSIGDHGFEMGLSVRVPGVLRRSVGAWMDEWLGLRGLSRSDIAGWAVHPGGRDILEGVRQGLGLPAESMEASRRVLAEHGNMSSGTVLWVVDSMLGAGMRGRVVAMSFGPGLSGEAVLLGMD